MQEKLVDNLLIEKMKREKIWGWGTTQEARLIDPICLGVGEISIVSQTCNQGCQGVDIQLLKVFTGPCTYKIKAPCAERNRFYSFLKFVKKKIFCKILRMFGIILPI